MLKPDYLPKRPMLNWLKAVCPVCSKEYGYFACSPDEKPKTCGRFECLYAYIDERMEKRGGS